MQLPTTHAADTTTTATHDGDEIPSIRWNGVWVCRSATYKIGKAAFYRLWVVGTISLASGMFRMARRTGKTWQIAAAGAVEGAAARRYNILSNPISLLPDCHS